MRPHANRKHQLATDVRYHEGKSTSLNQQLQQPSQHLDCDLMSPQTRSTQLICSQNSWPIETA